MTKDKNSLITGIIKRHADGFGFLIPDNPEHADVYIPKHFMTGVMTNDRVSAKVFKSRGDNRYHGEIIEITSRGTNKLVGRLTTQNDLWFLIPDDSKGWGQNLKIKKEDALKGKDGDLVQIEILTYPGEGTPFTGKVIEVIGNAEDPLTDVKRVLRMQNVPEEFSRATLTEVASLDEDPLPSDWKSRKSLMDLPLITIDGATAKDFDDAVYTEMTDTGFHLIVAIADVSHYVKPGTALDQDAYDRGTSVYFPNHVVPMLPEILSNGLCSLKPNVPRLCLVADMHFDFQGQIQKSKFYEAVMKSQARVTYGEAQEIIDGTDIEKFNHVKETILRCSDLAKVLMIRRFREGSLDLNISQTELTIDASGNPIDVQKSERLFAHRLIEELMLAANVAVAEFLERKEQGAIYRVHEDPSPDSIKLLEVYLHNLGSHIRLGGEKLQKKLSKALEQFADHAEGQIISILTLRSLSQAKYSSNNIGHFGLGFATYTHFTSPIRRYPDLIVHRLLKHYVVSENKYPMPSIDDLTTAGTILSSTEQRAVKCERQFMGIKKARFIQRFVGKEFTGMISSIARFGAFVLLREFDIDGLVKLENLGDDRWVFDEDNLRLMGERSHTVFKLGQMVKVTVTSVDVELGQINFDLDPEHKVTRKSRRASSQEGDRQETPWGSRPREKSKRGRDKNHRDRHDKPKGDDRHDRRKGHKPDDKERSKAGAPDRSKPTAERGQPNKGRHSKEKFFEKKGEKRKGSVKRIFDRDEEPGNSSKDSLKEFLESRRKAVAPAPKASEQKASPPKETEKAKPKSLKSRFLDILDKLDRSIEGGSKGADHRDRKDSGKDSKKRGKTKNNSRRLR
ncbi:MAG: ribonuclease [Pseudomonadota bacterium]|jgi:ribonuclease R